MNPAFWRKAVSDAWMQLVASAVLLMAFGWLFVWLMSFFEVGFLKLLVKMMPDIFKSMMEIDPALLLTRVGQLSILFTHPIVVLVAVGWALGRGSDSVSGEIGRGTMDLVASLPVRRATVILVPAAVATIGAALLPAAVALGIWLGTLTVALDEEVLLRRFVPGAVNLFCMTFCLTGITTAVSSMNRDRWRTIVISGGIYLVEVLIEVVRNAWPGGDWLKFFTFLSVFQPQSLILETDKAGLPDLTYNGTLIAIGVAAYAVAVVALTCRDIPAAK
ncbi:MAG: ABC transporter permease subunit [Candidatus Nealsonbacteria bacterium]|nr:ABC transporter permease subunit [Candidatus Nealsonbacteria bacterium]